MSARIVKEPIPNEVSMQAMGIGQIGTFFYGSETVIALRTYEGLVDLNNPNHTWRLNSDVKVSLLPAGTKIEIEAL